MNFGQMRDAFLSYTGVVDPLDNAELAFWFNEAQLDLAWELAPVEAYELAGARGTVFTPPDDWLVIIGGSKQYRVTGGGDIVLEEDGPCELYYRKIPEDFSGLNDEQTTVLHLGLHYLLPIFAAARYWEKEAEGDGEELNQASRWLSYYYQGKSLAKSRLFGINEPIDVWQIRR